jgi:hypothetical protein
VGKFRPRRSIKVYPEVRSILSRIRKVAQNVSVSNFVRMLPMESNVLGSSTSLWVAYSCWSSRCLNCCFTFSCFNYFHSTTNSRGLIPHPLHPRAPGTQHRIRSLFQQLLEQTQRITDWLVGPLPQSPLKRAIQTLHLAIFHTLDNT